MKGLIKATVKQLLKGAVAVGVFVEVITALQLIDRK